MLHRILAPDVDDERDARTKRCDVAEILLGPDAEIDAARLESLLEIRQHPLQAELVRNVVIVGVEAVGLGELDEKAPECGVVELRGRARLSVREPGETQPDREGGKSGGVPHPAPPRALSAIRR